MDAPLNTPHSAFRIPHCHEVRQRHRATLFRDPYQALQDPRRGHRIRARPVAALDLDPEEPRQGVETARLEGRDEAPGQAERADPRTLEQERARTLELDQEERPVEAHVMDDEHGPAEMVE